VVNDYMEVHGMARIPEGREMLQCTIDTESMSVLKVKAAMNRMTVGRFLDQLIRTTYSRDKIVEEWAAGATPEPRHTVAPKAPIRAARSPQEPRKAPTADEDTRNRLWLALEALRTTQGWTDAEVAKRIGFTGDHPERNVSLWRKAGKISDTRVEAVETLLSQHKG